MDSHAYDDDTSNITLLRNALQAFHNAHNSFAVIMFTHLCPLLLPSFLVSSARATMATSPTRQHIPSPAVEPLKSTPFPGGFFNTVVVRFKSAGRSRMTPVADLLAAVALFAIGASTEPRRKSRIAHVFHSTSGTHGWRLPFVFAVTLRASRQDCECDLH